MQILSKHLSNKIKDNTQTYFYRYRTIYLCQSISSKYFAFTCPPENFD